MFANGIISGQDLSGSRFVSVVTAIRYDVSSSGRCAAQEGTELQAQLEYYDGLGIQGRLHPQILKRDIDLYAWRDFTDLVVQGTIRTERALKTLLLTLECVGRTNRFSLAVRVTGDRWVERGPCGLRFSEPQPFTEIPARYDKAYGGFDSLAEERHGKRSILQFIGTQFGPEAARRTSRFAYPRNPAGKGYVIEANGAAGTALPNLEFIGDELIPASLIAPMDHWARRPYPAAFDWFSHAWFPRIGLFGVIPPTFEDEPPQPESRLGILAPGVAQLPRLKRIRREFAQGAHPFLWRHRLAGDERIRITAMSRDGRDFMIHLPARRPRIYIRQLTDAEETAPVVLDAVFVETDHDRVTLIWRGSLPARRLGMPRGWERLCAYRVVW